MKLGIKSLAVVAGSLLLIGTMAATPASACHWKRHHWGAHHCKVCGWKHRTHVKHHYKCKRHCW